MLQYKPHALLVVLSFAPKHNNLSNIVTAVRNFVLSKFYDFATFAAFTPDSFL